MTEKGFVFAQVQGKVATIEFGHPKANSMTLELLERLAQEIQKSTENKEVEVIVLRSEGEVFCSGASFDELLSIENEQQAERFFGGFAQVILALSRCEKVVIGRSIGKAVGGGVGILAACDYVMATEKSSIKLSELSIGLGAFVIAPAVERKIGKTAFAQLSLTNAWQNAYWAERKGLYSQVFSSVEDLDKELEFLSRTISQYSPQALQALQKVQWEDTAHWGELLPQRAKITAQLALSDFTKEKLMQFKNQ